MQPVIHLGEASEQTILLIIGAAFIALGISYGEVVFFVAFTVWLAFVLLTLARQF